MPILPDLPKQLRGQEAAFGLEFRRWWEKRRLPGNFELKHTKGKDSLPFSAVEPDQVIVAAAAHGKGILLRVTVGTPGSPDYIGQVGQPVYVVIRYPTAFYIISIDTFLLEKSRSKRKSLTAQRAEEISVISVKC